MIDEHTAGSRVFTRADVEALAADGDRDKLLHALSRIEPPPSLWPTKHVEHTGRLRYEWTVVDDPSGEVLAKGRAPFEKWAWHRAGVAAARIYLERHAARKAEAGS